MDLLPRDCPICGDSQEAAVYVAADFSMEKLDGYAFASRKYPEHMHYRLKLCGRCGLLYADPALPPQSLAKAYQEAAFDSGMEAHYAARTYAGHLGRFVGRLPESRSALDIGTGDGAFLEELLSAGFKDVIGIEPSKSPVTASRPDIRPLIREGVFRGSDFPSGRFTLVTCFQTLEHLSDPLATCVEIHRILEPGGAFYAVVHNRQSFANRLMGLKSPIFDIEHLQLFSPRSGAQLLRVAGFEGIEAHTLLNAYPLPYWFKLLPAPRNWNNAAIHFARKCGLSKWPIPFPAGNLAIVGFKRKDS